jgi:hypothetical protein
MISSGILKFRSRRKLCSLLQPGGIPGTGALSSTGCSLSSRSQPPGPCWRPGLDLLEHRNHTGKAERAPRPGKLQRREDNHGTSVITMRTAPGQAAAFVRLYQHDLGLPSAHRPSPSPNCFPRGSVVRCFESPCQRRASLCREERKKWWTAELDRVEVGRLPRHIELRGLDR